MAILDLAAFVATLPETGALIGIDPGSKTIGLAISDTRRIIASPIEPVKKKKFAEDAAKIFAEVDHRAIVGIVIGHPVNMDGSLGPSSQAARAFARNLVNLRDLPTLMWDERLSTAAVLRQMVEADVSRAKRREKVDSAAASYALQGLLDRLQEGATESVSASAPEREPERE